MRCHVTEFQSTHPSGVRLASGRHLPGRRPISIHAPQWGATCFRWRAWGRFWYFNPRTPVGCDKDAGLRGFHSVSISIHAPQWGATGVHERVGSARGISIHAPQWGATPDSSASSMSTISISIHAPQWGATGRTLVGPVSGSISIHAPQWGATALKSRLNDDLCISIHAPQWGATIMRVRLQLGDGFQSTHPSGVRPHTAAQPFALRHISIHAPQWGATHADRRLRARRDISIHAPQWGATHRLRSSSRMTFDFNPRTPVGCDRIP